MELKQALQVLAVLKAAYPQHYRGLSDGDIRAMATLWASMFEEPYGDVMQAVKAHIVTDARGFCPTIGAVKEQLARMRESRRGGALTEHEAWELVRQALKNGYYGAQQEFCETSRSGAKNPRRAFAAARLGHAARRAGGHRDRKQFHAQPTAPGPHGRATWRSCRRPCGGNSCRTLRAGCRRARRRRSSPAFPAGA